MVLKLECCIVLLIIYIFGTLSATDLVVKGLCGDPGMPERSTLSPQQNSYNENETVVYRCDEFISLLQSRKCARGKWRGKSAVCGKAFYDNDLIWAKVYDKNNGTLIEEYNTSVLISFNRFGNSFIAERYSRPLRAFGSKSYRFELTLQYKAVFHLVRIGLAVVNFLVDDSIKFSKFNISKVTVGPYRVCRLIQQRSVSPWYQNSTRFDFWYNCESIDDKSYEKELKEKTNLITIETESSAILILDLATLILTQQYLKGFNPYQPICGVPEVPIGVERDVIDPKSKYKFKCGPGFRDISGVETALTTHSLVCTTDMKWRGSLPQCMPDTTCKKFELSSRYLIEVYQYEKVYFYNDTFWLAIEETKSYFRCKNDAKILIGPKVRVCGKDGQWSSSLPNCLDIEDQAWLKGSSNQGWVKSDILETTPRI